MNKIYFTIAGMNYYYGTDIVKKETRVNLVKEPDNKYDREAILVEIPGLGAIGHVANSVNTVLGECYSAGRLYDRFKKKAKGKVVAVSERGVVCEFKKE
ncbi:MAG: HIRAN domain-containing protein [Eubacterium sp.]|nr:HIRAN domain-containing protein [Eubacterium sp.]